MPFSDLKPLTAKYIHQVWQKEWDEAIVVSKTHKRFKERFLIGRNRTKCANFQVELIVCFPVFWWLYIAWKRGLPKKIACFVLFHPIKKLSLNLLCVLDLFSECWQSTLFHIFYIFVTVSNTFHDTLPKLPDKLLTFCNRWKEDTIWNRLHVGNSYFLQSFLLKKEEPSVCVACNTTIRVKHILIGCADLVEVRKKYFEERSL